MTEFKAEIIGASWGRNGTASLKKALEILGYPCYHMIENIENKQAPFWIRAADGEKVNFHEVYVTKNRTYTASTDFPSCVYWREQLVQYPEAKVILTVRDPQRWYQSCSETIFRMQVSHPNCPLGVKVAQLLGLPIPRFTEMVEKIIYRDAMKGDWGKENVIKQYVAHNEEVKRECPAEKLLVFEVSEGWEPLCAFLNKPVPSQPFPHVNDSAEFSAFVKMVDLFGKAVLALVVLAPVGGYFAYQHYLSK